MKKKLEINKFLIIYIFLLVVSIILSIAIKPGKVIINYEKNLFIMSWVINILFLFSIYTIYKLKKNILDFNIIFLVFLFLFCNGQVFLYSLGIPLKDLIVLKVSTSNEVIISVIYFYYFMLLFQIGFCFKSKFTNSSLNVNDDLMIKAIRIFSICLLSLSSIPFFFILLPKLKMSILYGYNYLYVNSIAISGIVNYLSKFFIPSLILFLFSYKDNKVLRNIIILFLLLIAMANLIIGTRGDALSIVVILIIFYHNYIKRFEGKRLFKLATLCILIILLISIIANFRTSESKSIEGFLDSTKNTIQNKENNFFVKTISELGYTMHSFILTRQVVPSVEKYKYGESYFASLMMILPKQIFGGYSFADKAALDIWLQKIHNLSYGPGYSLVAETYYNFGFVGGVIFSAVLGYFFTIMFNLKNKSDDKSALLRLLSLIFLYNSLIVARFPFHSIPRNIVYMFIIPYFCINLIYNDLLRRAKK